MGVGLPPLEFSECLADSPVFRENLQRHEKELEKTSLQIKRLIKEVKDVVHAAQRLGASQLALAETMEQFEFTCVGASMTEDERVISRSLKQFAALIREIENERERMLGRANDQIVEPLERFRKEHIGAVKETKKKFDKKTAKFCQSQERTLSLSTKKPDAVYQEAEAALEMCGRDVRAASAEYVRALHALHERKKFELLEPVLGFVYGWWTFHHTAHDVHADSEHTVRDLQLRIQRTRTNFEETSKQTESLMKKIMEKRNKEEEAGEDGGLTRAGYMFLMEKKAFGTTWTKHYIQYWRDTRTLAITSYNQLNPKAYSATATERIVVTSCVPLEEGERRHCVEVRAAPPRAPLVLQATSAGERAAWLRAVCAGQPQICEVPAPTQELVCELDDAGFRFVRGLIAAIEGKGLQEQGLYRVGGASSKVRSLLASWRRPPPLNSPQQETRTLCSALKGYLRALPEPLLTRQLHHALLDTAKRESRSERISAIRTLLTQLPARNREMLVIIIRHLRNVCAESEHNLMSASNLAVCFGPTLLRAERETVAAILEIKFCNVLVETLLEHADTLLPEIVENRPTPAPITSSRNDINASRWSCDRYPSPQQRLLTQWGSVSGSAESLSGRRVRTLYACLAESEGELSFEPNQIVTDVAPSGEPGWLRGTLHGRTGLLPENYVEPLP